MTSSIPVEFILENRQFQPVDEALLLERLALALQAEHPPGGVLSIALVDDAEMQRVNCQFLGHDWPTDVVSFSYAEGEDQGEEPMDGELVVSVDTAIRQAAVHGWSLNDELLLYCVHGFLHLCGYDDLTDDARRQMRQRERELLSLFGLVPKGLQS